MNQTNQRLVIDRSTCESLAMLIMTSGFPNSLAVIASMGVVRSWVTTFTRDASRGSSSKTALILDEIPKCLNESVATKFQSVVFRRWAKVWCPTKPPAPVNKTSIVNSDLSRGIIVSTSSAPTIGA